MRSLTLVALSVALASCGEGSPSDAVPDEAAIAAGAPEAEATPALPDPVDALSGPQRNARKNAEEFLAMSGFSRDGLIHQLSSEYGSGYAVADATAAVDSLDVDWNEQATRSAQSFLEMTGFSCQGLIQQLSSDHGSKFTREQAEHGAKAAGAC